jgi:hypothetical protein
VAYIRPRFISGYFAKFLTYESTTCQSLKLTLLNDSIAIWFMSEYIDVFSCFNSIGIGMDGMENEKINIPKGLCFRSHDFWPSCNPDKDLCFCCFDTLTCYESTDECKSHCPPSSSGVIKTSPSALP